ncbi:hypothetical protein C2E21_2426 [Chlorella sorokiniana]|uniref:Methyltransferase domain-containing protein n=1 Tax=Chlorella sorokiniana TaxID=3076 RepID=A0A2P6TYW0_CHLSO|nr:hypothetical protein C2E21_2426 [Chlorella sorokiniana]|eukprot:PRW59252.1 hypothetical protein C2E21_2426 [Chlorella sorokiniana]
MHQKHCSGALQHFLEVACGPAQHAILLAKTAGCAATGLDLSPAMLAYAAQQAQAAGVASSLSCVEADMSKDGWAAQLAQPADLACILLGSLAHCLDNGAALRCFAELSKAVRPGGLLVLELPHPSDLWGGYCLEEEQFIEAWDAENEDKSKTVLVEWGREGDQFDLQEQILHRTVGLSCYRGDELVSSKVEVVPQRQFTLQEIDLLARATGFEVVEVHGDFDASIDLDHEEAYRSPARPRAGAPPRWPEPSGVQLADAMPATQGRRAMPTRGSKRQQEGSEGSPPETAAAAALPQVSGEGAPPMDEVDVMIAAYEQDTEQYYGDRVSGPPVGNRDAPTPQRVRAKRQRRETQKARENLETEAMLREMRAGGGAAALSPSARAPRRREGGSKPGGWRGRARGGGMGGMGGFGVRGGSSGPTYQPMALLPGEQRLHVEALFGEGRPMSNSGKPAAKLADGTHSELPVPQRYAVAVEDARARLAARMRGQGAAEAEVESMLQLLRDFEAKCLAAQPPAAPEDCKQLCAELDGRLRDIYNRDGRELVLHPHILSAKALWEQEGQDDLQHMRVMERRFIIWTPADAPGAEDSQQQQQHPQQKQKQQQQQRQRQQQQQPGDGEGGTSSGSGEPDGSSGQHQGGAWDQGLAGIWREFTQRLESKRYGDITLNSTANTVSCALNDTEWKDGQLKRVGVKQNAAVMKQIEQCQKGARQGRLYVTDGSMPDYEAQQYPADAPGMPCGVDARANEMMPHAVRSNRATNLFHTLKSESTGTKTFTLFGPAGGGTNLTAFHFETKRRRSYNCGTGDFIVQPLATMEVMRKVMRVHAAVAGRHTRHGQLLPLEVYLEEGIPLVLHVRDYPRATLCELCEQSLHAFVSFSTVACSPPALKVSCNDLDLVWELDSCYWLEKLATLYTDLKVLPEEALPPDGADSWVMSSYLLRLPHTRAEKQAGWEHPWLCEAQGDQSAAALAGLDRLEDEDMHWSMDIVAVRCAEKLLDVLAGKLAATAAWAGEVPCTAICCQALRRLLPVLADLRRRAVSEEREDRRSAEGGSFEPLWPAESHFSREYIEDLVAEVEAALQRADAEGGGSDMAAQGAASGGGSSGAHPALLSDRLHAVYAAADGAERAQLARQADAALLAGVPQLASPADAAAQAAGGGARAAGGAPALPALSAELAPAVLRSHWLLRLQLEWEAATAEPFSLPALAERRRQRSALEQLMDESCARLSVVHTADWDVQA